eukprot:scaffold333784_cov38-Prasinocladus_malaysianus.AAC.1
MCYNIPVIEALHSDPGSSALYIFPTKALAQDQLRATRELLLAAFGHEGPQIDVRLRLRLQFDNYSSGLRFAHIAHSCICHLLSQ